MRTTKKPIFCLILILVMLCGALPLNAFAVAAPTMNTHAIQNVTASNNVLDTLIDEPNYGDVIIKDEVEYAKGKDFICQNIVVLDDGMVAFTQETYETDTDNVLDESKGYPEREKTKVFSHIIYDRNGNILATVYSTVTGIYSAVDHEAYLTSISGNPTGQFAHAISCGSSISGATGSLNLYWYGVPLVSFTYKIYTNGNIQNI